MMSEDGGTLQDDGQLLYPVCADGHGSDLAELLLLLDGTNSNFGRTCRSVFN